MSVPREALGTYTLLMHTLLKVEVWLKVVSAPNQCRCLSCVGGGVSISRAAYKSKCHKAYTWVGAGNAPWWSVRIQAYWRYYRTRETVLLASIVIVFRGHNQREYVINSGSNGRNKVWDSVLIIVVNSTKCHASRYRLSFCTVSGFTRAV